MAALGIQGLQLLTQLFSFLILIYLLWRFAYRPILNALDMRAERVRASMDQADRIERQLAETEKRNEEILAESRREAQQIRTQAREDAERTIAEAVGKAQDAGQRQLEQSLAQLRAEEQRAKNELRQQFADLVIRAASRVVRQELDPQKHLQLIDTTLREADRSFDNGNGAQAATMTMPATLPSESPTVQLSVAPQAIASEAFARAQAAGVLSAEPIGGQCPVTFPVKGNQGGEGVFIYHVPGSASYDRTTPEVCFATEADARTAGFRAPR